MTKGNKAKGMDLGKVLLWSAVLVEAPRWAGAMLAADVSEIAPWMSTTLNVANSFAGAFMGILVVVATAYLFDALRGMKPATTLRRKSGDVTKANWRFWGLAGFAFGLLALTPFVLGPYIVSRMTGETIAAVLANPFWQFTWAVMVVVAPAFVIGGVAFAQPGLVRLSSSESDRKEGTGGGKVAESRSERGKGAATVAASDQPAFGTLRPNWRDWRDVPESEYARIASLTVEKVMQTYGRPERTARNWVKNAKKAVNGGKPLQDELPMDDLTTNPERTGAGVTKEHEEKMEADNER